MGTSCYNYIIMQHQNTRGYTQLVEELERARAADDTSELCGRFIAVRGALGLTQAESARVYRVGYSSYTGYEQGRSMPRGDVGREVIKTLTRLEKHHNLDTA